MNPTSCPMPWLASSDRSPLLADRARLSQSPTPNPFMGVAPHSAFLVFSAYPVAGKNPDVHVLGEK